MRVVPITYRQACAFVKKYHRHHKPPQGHKFSIGLSIGEELIGVAIVGRPVSRRVDDGSTAEVTRLCTNGTKNACSKLYAACWRAARAMGYTKLVTYILNTEPGTSLIAAGWKLIGESRGGSWSVPSRPREDSHPLQMKLKFEISSKTPEEGKGGEGNELITVECLEKLGFNHEDLGDETPYDKYVKHGIEVWDFNGRYWLVDMLDQAGIDREFHYLHELEQFFNGCGLSIYR